MDFNAISYGAAKLWIWKYQEKSGIKALAKKILVFEILRTSDELVRP